MKTNVKIIADSICNGKRITSFELVYPRIIHAEVMTHRVFSRNAASSRAIPSDKLIESVMTDPFIPIAFQKKHKGMQGNEYLDDTNAKTWYVDTKTQETLKTDHVRIPSDHDHAVQLWLRGRDEAVKSAQALASIGVTKQLSNRILEPFQYYKVLLTATEFDNFFKLRCPQYRYGDAVYRSWKDLVRGVMKSGANRDVVDELEGYSIIQRLKMNESQAEIHVSQLAEYMWDAMNQSNPKPLEAGEWHIPYGDDITELSVEDYLRGTVTGGYIQLVEVNATKAKIATARCARVSYTTVGNDVDFSYEKDIKLHDGLLASGHMSPFEHCAQATGDSQWYGNFNGWKQYRKFVE